MMRDKPSFGTTLSPILENPFLHITLLLILTWVCWGATLGNYFLADDFFEIGYVHKIFNGHPEYILDNLLGPYMQKRSQLVYRPGMLMTQVIDYAIWGPRAIGFHLSNLLYYSGNVILFYLLIRRIPGTYRNKLVSVAAFFSAALFALSPLHCESVAWIIGRVDNDCCFYYLLSLVLLLHGLRNNSRISRVTGLISFAVALCTKEMAMGLPLVLTSALFLFPQNEPVETSCKSVMMRLKQAFALSWSAWAVLVGFFIFRSLALGSFPGGYQGSMGDLQNSLIVSQWTDLDNWKRVLMPFSDALTPQSKPYMQLMQYCLWSLGAIMLALVMVNGLSLRWLIFIVTWALTTMVPVLRWWTLGEFLQAARFHYFFTMPLSALAAIPLFTSVAHRANRGLLLLQKALLTIALIALTVLVFILGWDCCHTNQFWIDAGKEVESIRRQLPLLAASNQGKRIILLGLPCERFGVHEIENPYMFSAMVKPPFSSPIADRFVVFLPSWFVKCKNIETATLRRALADPEAVGPYVWNTSKCKFELVRLHLPAASSNLDFSGSNVVTHTGGPNNNSIYGTLDTWLPVKDLMPSRWYDDSMYHRLPRLVITGQIARLMNMGVGTGFYISGLHLNPLVNDYLEFEYRNTSGSGKTDCRVAWNEWADLHVVDPTTLTYNQRASVSDNVSLPCSNDQFRKAVCKLSSYWTYFTTPEINSMRVTFDSAEDIEVRNLHLYSERKVAPEIAVTNLSLGTNAAYYVDQSGLDLYVLLPPHATNCAIRLEISQSNFMFAQLELDHTQAVIGKVVTLKPGVANCHLNLASLPGSGPFQQIRAVCLDVNGKVVGQYSDPITIVKPRTAQ